MYQSQSGHSRFGGARSLRVLMAIALLAASLLSAQVAAAADDPGAVYSITNEAAGNRVMIFARAADGSLAAPEYLPTGGQGTGAALGSQGAVALSDNGRWLFVVNAGSSEISSFAVRPDGLDLVDKVGSGGTLPVSLTVHGDLLYVLNASGPGNISGFRVANGRLSPLAGSTLPLSSGAAGPAQVQFDATGTVLVVTEKATSLIDTYVVGADGVAVGPSTHPSAGSTPFGFDIDRQGHVVVSEAVNSGASSYQLGSDGSLALVSASVTNGGAAACWVAISKDGRFAYTANAGSHNVSQYTIGQDGSLALHPDGAAAGIVKPLDLAISNNGAFLYVLDVGSNRVMGFGIGADGSLTDDPVTTAAFSPSAAGLAAR